MIRIHRLNLRQDLTKALMETKPHDKITFEVTDARRQREEETGIGLERDIYGMFWKEVLDILFDGCSERVPF